MKLIDILVEELPKRGGWPGGAAFVAQEEGGWLWSFTSKPQKDCDDEWMDESSSGYHNKVGKLPEASDHDTSSITREQYEAALAAKNDGWIEWGGGKCPVEKGKLIDVKWRDGKVDTAIPAKIKLPSRDRQAIIWHHSGYELDIIAYRLHQPTKSEQVRADAWNAYAGIEKVIDEADLNECIGQAPVTTWSGDGLPPVGCECEFMKHTLDAIPNWRRGIIKYVSEYTVVIVEALSPGEFVAHPRTCDFRPIRSEADRKRNESLRAIYEILDAGISTKQDAADIYDAIAAGKIPGMKLED